MKIFSVASKNHVQVSASGIRKSFGRFSLEIDKLELCDGQIYALIGANGCGKSITAKLLAGLIPADTGEVKYDGLTVRDITLIPQKPYLIRDTVMANLTYPLKIRKIKPDMDTLEYYLELAGLQDLKKAYAPGLSGGERQKLAFIRAMVFSPKVIFADETFSNMDMKSQTRFEEHVVNTQKKSPITWVIISHQLSAIKRVCDYVFYMDNGNIVEEGETSTLLPLLADS
ncbi:MAG: ABC transporter ATP-binding protein [Firmicutes bacterium]|nr:ABC transporter ATP-binding protein [Bacillota bacterium]